MFAAAYGSRWFHALARADTGWRCDLTQPRLSDLFIDGQTIVTALPLGKLLTVTLIVHNEACDSAESTPATITLS